MTEPNRSQSTDRILSRNQTRQVDRWAIETLGLPGVVLMENAGAGVARKLVSLGCRGPVVILCGPGNNGGDGFVIARHLFNLQIPVACHLSVPATRYSGDSAVHLQVAKRLGVPVIETPQAERAVRWETDLPVEWLVDALLGTGASGELREPILSWVQAANRSTARKLAVDLPTGLDADTGELASEVFRADATVTLVARKPGLVEPKNKEIVGELSVVSIGVEPNDETWMMK